MEIHQCNIPMDPLDSFCGASLSEWLDSHIRMMPMTTDSPLVVQHFLGPGGAAVA